MRHIVSDAFCEGIMIRVVGVLLIPFLVDVVGVAIGPNVDLATAT
jgi:hypothetical protein